jgi:hypothetical protein
MKKLLCIALFSIAIMANAAEKREIVVNNSKEVKVEKNDFSKEMKTVKSDFKIEISEDEIFFGCGSDGNDLYDALIALGLDHRDARAARRVFVRDCRGFGPGGWIVDVLNQNGYQ